MKNTFFLLIVIGILHIGGCSASDKTVHTENDNSMKQKHFSNEQIQADALALAHIRCEWEVSKYNADLQNDNRKLQLETERLSDLKASFEQNMKIRYLQIDELEKKFNKELEKAQKQLNVCIDLDAIHKMQAAMEKTEGENQ